MEWAKIPSRCSVGHAFHVDGDVILFVAQALDSCPKLFSGGETGCRSPGCFPVDIPGIRV